MRREACREMAGDLALRAIGRNDAARDLAIDAHLDGCADCRAALAEMRDVAIALGRVNPDSLGEALDAPSSLAARVLAGVGGAISVRRRRRTLLAVAAAAVVVLAGVGLTIAVTTRGSDGADRLVAVGGVGSVTGSVELNARAWGTEVTLDLAGLNDEEIYWLWLTGADGERIAAGTLIGTGGDIHAVLASAIQLDATTRIWMTDEDDAVVFDEVLADT